MDYLLAALAVYSQLSAEPHVQLIIVGAQCAIWRDYTKLAAHLHMLIGV